MAPGDGLSIYGHRTSLLTTSSPILAYQPGKSSESPLGRSSVLPDFWLWSPIRRGIFRPFCRLFVHLFFIETMKEDRRDGSKRSTWVEIALTIAGSVIDNILRIVNCLSKRRWMDRKNDRVKKIRYELCTLCLNKNVSHICPIIFTLSTGRITRVTCNFWK